MIMCLCGNCIRSRSQLDLVSTDRHNFVTCIQAAQYLDFGAVVGT